MRYLTSDEFETLKAAQQLIPYMEDVKDKEDPQVCWSVYGNPQTNEILVRLAGEKATLIGAKPTEVLFPAMADRVFGIDMADEQLAEAMSLDMYAKYKQETA